MKGIQKPLVNSFILITLICVIYFLTNPGTDKSLGKAAPINLSNNPTSYDFTQDEKLKKAEPKGEENKVSADESLLKDDTEVPLQGTDSKQAINDGSDLTSQPFMPKMANETLKAQLGNAAWKLFHTILARYPDKPSQQERTTLEQYIRLFAQVYPCGDCARHFQELLSKFPPQTGSRKTAAIWGCDIHNKVNDRLGKPRYDCTTILEDYDCGCGDDEKLKDDTLNDESIDHLKKIHVNEKVGGVQAGG
ncbi:Piso0_002746 [Millerozyma farinosa CBS 7064]|uniref:Sulfhydryl oxidase n=1 Tax=Pichia sorbitophila (strain ATCC MYA-4447 / BCRC 22081 / CBS 7064 / NBRC 10061 / NRRL Y-12695) TaxID=559304 RepID=G8YDE4_PICSO|nr:Piso0_002746 [Millerozyma farinosa CBS 7064]